MSKWLKDTRNINLNQETEAVRKKIVEAAENRFFTYGFGKTTMAEIAQDLNMSAANLYRYFQNKQDIAGYCAERCISARNESLRATVRQSHLSAAERLHAFALGAFHYNFETSKNNPKINEIVGIVSSQKPELVKESLEAQTALIAEILSLGNETGEFAIDDVIGTAQTVYATLVLFDVPTFLSLYSKEVFEEKANKVVNLLLKGLNKR